MSGHAVSDENHHVQRRAAASMGGAIERERFASS
jgi:hypothetical protein